MGDASNKSQEVTLSGDATITNTGVVAVTKIQGTSVKSGMTPSSGQVLTWDNTNSRWDATNLPTGNAGTVTSVATGTGLTGGPITTSGTLAVDVGTTANKIVQLDTSGKLPAIDGSQLTNLPIGGGSSALSGITAATATNTIDNTNYAQTWNWSTATTQNPMTMVANGLTTGSVLRIFNSNGSLNTNKGLLYVANTGLSTNGLVARFQGNNIDPSTIS